MGSTICVLMTTDFNLFLFIWRSVSFEPRSGIRAYIQNSGFSPCIHYVTALACPVNLKAGNVSVPFADLHLYQMNCIERV